MKLVFFKKPQCDICLRWLATIDHYKQQYDPEERVDFEAVDAMTPDGQARLFAADFGHIPAVIGLKDGEKEDIGSDASLWWNDQPKWQDLIEFLKLAYPPT